MTGAIAARGAIVPVPPCPSWCVLPPDHDVHDLIAREFDGVINRMHSAGEWTSPDVTAQVDIVQTTVCGDPEDQGEAYPTVFVHADDGLTAAQARALASALAAAADRLDEIGSAS